jgi:UDP-N-acetylmuramoyl-L-alanyl-D-glutamate--2,6-diaminopimelate ligase
MERVDGDQPFLVVVDYSHKPAGVAGALQALRALTTGRLIIVLGCGGDRDRGKRPVMGEVAATEADVLIVTDDNPRSELPAEIRAAMIEGARSVPSGRRAMIVEEGDRRAAIMRAVALAGPGDTVLIAGKGHETGQEVAGVLLPFDDVSVALDALAAHGYSPSDAARLGHRRGDQTVSLP